jgi:hypothetical protein
MRKATISYGFRSVLSLPSRVSTLTSVTGVITSVATCITAVGGAGVTLKVLVPIMRTGDKTHNIVNSQRTSMQAYQEDLTAALQEGGITIPQDKSLHKGDV